jgi:hypothetical protein
MTDAVWTQRGPGQSSLPSLLLPHPLDPSADALGERREVLVG